MNASISFSSFACSQLRGERPKKAAAESCASMTGSNVSPQIKWMQAWGQSSPVEQES